jgi:molybdenum cofactor cytidylyltransferase
VGTVLKSSEGSLKSPFSGLILAGGLGRRWGGPKAEARLPDGRTFLQACAEVFLAAGASPVVATVPFGRVAAEMFGVGALPLPEPDLDMFSSLRWGTRGLLEDPGWKALVVLPVDHPLIRPETIAELVEAGPLAAVPTLAGRHGHPVCLWREVAEGILSGVLAGPTLREVLRAAGSIDVPVEDPGVRANCNTPEALKQALRGLDSVER